MVSADWPGGDASKSWKPARPKFHGSCTLSLQNYGEFTTAELRASEPRYTPFGRLARRDGRILSARASIIR